MSKTSTWLNGVSTTHLSALDRSILYGQTVFETAVIDQGRVLLRTAHLGRLHSGCQTLGIPLSLDLLNDEMDQLCQEVELAVLRITVSMGEGGRGYANPVAPQETRILSLHEFPDHPKEHVEQGIRLGVADIRLGQQPALAGIKHGNRLEQIIALSQWHDDWHEAVLLDQLDNVIEATQSNLFLVRDNALITPDLSQAGVAGVMRDFILEHANKLGLTCKIMSLSLADIAQAQAVFVSNSVIGLWPVSEMQNGHTVNRYKDFSIAHQLIDLMKENGAIPTR